MRIFSDIGNFLLALRFVDVVFFLAVLILMILVITLIYFIKINDGEFKKKTCEETAEMRIVRDLKDNMNGENKTVQFTDYEKEQENKAIISYDELVKKSNNYDLNYVEEKNIDDLTVKQVDLDNLFNKKQENMASIEVRVISFAKEEAFLQALKQVQQELG